MKCKYHTEYYICLQTLKARWEDLTYSSSGSVFIGVYWDGYVNRPIFANGATGQQELFINFCSDQPLELKKFDFFRMLSCK